MPENERPNIAVPLDTSTKDESETANNSAFPDSKTNGKRLNCDNNAAMHIYALTTIILWSVGNVITKIALTHFTPEATAFLRYLVAAVSLLCYSLYKKMRIPPLKDAPAFIFGGIVGFAGYVYIFNIGMKTVEAGTAAFILGASPVITVLLARIILSEKLSLKGWISVAVAFSGVGIISLSGSGLSINKGSALICVAAVLISVYNIFQRKLLKRYSALEITTYCIITGALLLSVFAPSSFPQLRDASLLHITSIIALGIFAASAAYICWAYALGLAKKTGDVTKYMFLTPIFTTFFGFIMINEKPHISTYIGGTLVLLGVALVRK